MCLLVSQDICLVETIGDGSPPQQPDHVSSILQSSLIDNRNPQSRINRLQRGFLCQRTLKVSLHGQIERERERERERETQIVGVLAAVLRNGARFERFLMVVRKTLTCGAAIVSALAAGSVFARKKLSEHICYRKNMLLL